MKIQKGHSVPVLDKGFVELVAYMGEDEDFVRAARQSTGGGFVAWEPYEGHPGGDAGLLDFLYRNHHATPFEMGDMIVSVKLPIMVVREWHRSRTQSYNEMSGRYIQLPNEQYIPDLSRFLPVVSNNKQAASVNASATRTPEEYQGMVINGQHEQYTDYETMLQGGVPKEVARVNTPVSQYTQMWAKANIRNWFHFLNLRMRPKAQYEIRVYANEIAKFIQNLWPRTYNLFEEYDLYAAHLSRTEMRVVRAILEDADLTPDDQSAWGKKLGLSKSQTTELLEKLAKGGDEIL